MKRYQIGLYLLTCTLISCGIQKSENKIITYQNIVILSDLSSRIRNKPVKDFIKIKYFLNYFKDSCVKPGEKIGDKSSIYFSTFSDIVATKIDLDDIKKIGDKQSFINSTNGYKDNGLIQNINEFEKKINDIYLNNSNRGLDLISMLIEKIEKEPIVKKDYYLTDGNDTTFINFDNHINIFTDGYLEYSNKNINSQFYFSSSEIEKVRNYCRKNNTTIINALNNNQSFCLQPYISKWNKLINLHILETHERDKDDFKGNYSHIVGQRDNEILEAVWRKWAVESGFKSFTWEKY